MNSFDYRFWIAVGGATMFKLMTSRFHSPTRAVVTVLAAVFSAWVFTDPLVHFMGWPDTSRNAVAALLSLMGEGTMRWIIRTTPDKLIEIWQDLRK